MSNRHFAFIASLPCCISGREGVEVCHVRYPDDAFDKPMAGVGAKPADCWVLPLTPEWHRTGPDAQHSSGEREWWAARGHDTDDVRMSPLALCRALWAVSGDVARGRELVRLFRTGAPIDAFQIVEPNA